MKRISQILKIGIAILMIVSVCMVSVEQITFHHVHILQNDVVSHSHPYIQKEGAAAHHHSKSDFNNILLSIDLFHFVEAVPIHFDPYTDFKTTNLYILAKTDIPFSAFILNKGNKDPPHFC